MLKAVSCRIVCLYHAILFVTSIKNEIFPIDGENSSRIKGSGIVGNGT